MEKNWDLIPEVMVHQEPLSEKGKNEKMVIEAKGSIRGRDYLQQDLGGQ